jgi:DUF1365 family protein
MNLKSALYFGKVMHRRHRPRPHKLRHDVFWMLLDLDDVDALDRHLTLFSHNRFNVFSIYDTDHGDGSATPLRAQIGRHLAAGGIEAEKIFLLCMPRTLGYSFNPLSIYFCLAANGEINAILYEVHNTFGERHSYLAPTAGQAQPFEHSCEKEFYVSPFMGMQLTYAFRVAIDGPHVAVTIRGADNKGPMIDASLAGSHAALTDGSLLRAMFAYPLVTLKVIAAIHWHALRMLLKGYRIAPRPKPPRDSVSVIGGGK